MLDCPSASYRMSRPSDFHRTRDATTPAAGGKTTEISGMDLVLLRGEQLSRNEVYFDRMALFADMSR